MRNEALEYCCCGVMFAPNARFCFVLLLVSSAIGCATDSINEEPAEAFDLKEPPSPSQTTSPKVIEPSERTDKLLSFEPDAFSWSKPGYRVVVHLPEDGTKSSDLLPEHHLLAFPTRYGSLVKGHEQPSVKAKKAMNTDIPFLQGIYLPEKLLPGPPTLHLFTCPHDKQMRYQLGEINFVCGKIGEHSVFEIPPESEPGKWVYCDIQRLIRAWKVGAWSRDGNLFARVTPPEVCKDEMDLPSHAPWEGVAVYADDILTAGDELVTHFAVTPADFHWQFDDFSEFVVLLTQKYYPENRW